MNFEIAFVTIVRGKIAMARTISIVSADKYWFPNKDRINVGEVSSAAIIGEVTLMPILKLPDVRSLFEMLDAGMTMYAILETRLPTNTVISRAM